MHFTILDYIILAVILISIVISFFRGFLREAISLLTWFAAFWAGLKLAPILSGLNIMQRMISHNTARYVTAAIMVFLIVLIVGMLMNKLAHVLITTSGLGFFDRVLGFIFGAARGGLFAVIILVVISAMPAQNAAWATNSQLAPYFKPLVDRFSVLIPKEIAKASTWVDKLRTMIP